MKRFSTDRSFMDKGSEALLWISGGVCLLLPVILLVVVFVRAILPAGIPIWSLDICELLMWFPAYFGLGLVWRMGKHVRVTVFIDRMHGKIRRIIDLTVLILTLSISAAMLWAGTRASLVSWIEHRRTYSEFPEYYLSIAIPIGIAFLTYEIWLSLRSKLRNLRERTD